MNTLYVAKIMTVTLKSSHFVPPTIVAGHIMYIEINIMFHFNKQHCYIKL